MSKAFKAKWLGDTDPAAQVVTIGNLTFVKGESVNVPADYEHADMVRDNPTFAIDDSKAEATQADEGAPIDPEAGTEKAALKDQIEAISGERPKGNPSVETLRSNLAKLNS